MIVAVALSPSLDVTYVVDELDGIQRPLEVHRMAGGKALNAARAAAAMGAQVTALTVLGGGTGAMVAEEAGRCGVHLEVIEGEHVTRTCVSVFARGSGTLTEIYEHPTSVSQACFDELLERLPGVVGRGPAAAGGGPGWCLVSGGMPTGLGDGALARVVLAARAAGVRVAVDTHGGPLREVVAAAQPDVLKVNRAEATEVLDVAAGTGLVEIVEMLAALTGGIVVVTDGTAGAVGTDGHGSVRAVLPEPVGSFPVGSGDSFLGGLLVALDRGDALVDALRLATACATANAQVPGAARFDPATVHALADAVQVGAASALTR